MPGQQSAGGADGDKHLLLGVLLLSSCSPHIHQCHLGGHLRTVSRIYLSFTALLEIKLSYEDFLVNPPKRPEREQTGNRKEEE